MKQSVVRISNNSFQILKSVINEAQDYIKIASFLFYDQELCDLLIQKIKLKGIQVEVLTTPPEAAESEDLKESAAHIQNKMMNSGIKVVVCDWEVGQPELTIATRAGGRIPRWFAMHAKFIVTDKCALITSVDIVPNLSANRDWNTHILYRNPERTKLLHRKYEKLKSLFLEELSNLNSNYIDTSVSPRKLIRGYPLQTIRQIPLQDGFYVLPHEAYGRQIIEKAIYDAEEFIFLMFETIYDDEIVQFIIKKLISTPGIDFRIVTSPLTAYVQNPAKTRANFVQLASHGVKIRTMRNLKAKMLVTDKVLISGSFDLVKMGIGTKRTIRSGLKALVASTEIIDINTQRDYIEEAKAEFLRIFDESVEEYGLWFSKDAEKILRSAGAEMIARDAKEFLGYLIFNERRKSSKRIRKISLIAVEIAKMRKTRRIYVKVEDIQKAEQILLLHERNELNEENVCGILGILDAKQFLRGIKNILED